MHKKAVVLKYYHNVEILQRLLLDTKEKHVLHTYLHTLVPQMWMQKSPALNIHNTKSIELHLNKKKTFLSILQPTTQLQRIRFIYDVLVFYLIINSCISEAYFRSSRRALCKICERVIDVQLKQFLSYNGSLPCEQSGVQSGFSCATALASLTDDIFKSTDEGKLTVVISDLKTSWCCRFQTV